MLARPHRLPATVRLRSSKTVYTAPFLFKYANSEESVVRCRVIVSKKVDKRATRRNYLRRTIHEVIQELLPTFKQADDLLFIIKPEAMKMEKAALQETVLQTLKKNGLV